MQKFQEKKVIITCFICIYSCLSTWAQTHPLTTDYLVDQIESLASHYPSESIYLQTSKGIYETEEDVWFKAYILNAQSFIPSIQSQTLFVQLINDHHTVVWQEKYEIENGFVDGHIYLQDSLHAGNYTLAAYSSHSLYESPKEFNAVRLLKVVKKISETKEVSKEKQHDGLDFRMFPEGGDLISGIRSKLAFKAVNSKGNPVDISGILLEDDKPILEFNSEYAGMGSFVFTPDITKQYRIEISDSVKNKSYSIPKIKAKGTSMQLIESNEGFLVFKVSRNSSLLAKNIYLRLQIRGQVYSLAKSRLKQHVKIKVPLKDLPQGIAEVTLFNENFEPIRERLVYINADQKLYIKATLNKSEYETREQAKLKLKVTDHQGNPIIAHLGLSVSDNIYRNSQDSKNILTHNYLSSQLKGNVYNPLYYFNEENKNRKAALDVLMLTQGWRRYIWTASHLKGLNNQKQQVFETIKGQVIFPKKHRKKPLETLPTLMAFAPEKEHPGGLDNLIFTDSIGAFTILPRHLKQGPSVYLKLMVPEGSKFSFKANDNTFRTIDTLRHTKLTGYPLASIYETRHKNPKPFKYPAGIKELDEVMLKGKKRKVYRDKYLGKLDSIANLWNRDYVAVCNALNCFVHGREGSTKPEDGKTYRVLLGKNGEHLGEFHSSGVYYGEDRIIYKAPRLTEAYLLKKFNLIRIKGYYGKREFYTPVYDKENINDPFPDYRNTLFWKPDVITDKNGEATVRFYCSDINTRFTGVIEGVDNSGLLGWKAFEFLVRKRGD